VGVVLDTVLFVRALMNPFGLWGRVVFDYGDAHRLVVSRPVIAEASPS